jgi:hypothetical protein
VKPSTPSSTEITDPRSIPWPDLVKEFSKDMNMIGWNVDAQLIENRAVLQQLVREKLKISPNEITALFYRMGIDENRAGLALANKQIIEGIDEICSLILKRSEERIILRNRN